MKFAVLAPGSIAKSIGKALDAVPELERYAVASRDINRAKAFVSEYGFEKSYGSYEEMLDDKEVELVYVASPHSLHYKHAKMCLQKGKNVLLEKAFTVNFKQAEELIKLSNEKRLFLAEAIWTRYMPSRQLINDILKSGIIGEYKLLTANLGYEMNHKKRLVEPMLAGGALLDVGIYPINFALMTFGTDFEKIDSTVFMTPSNVDGMESITIKYKDGKMAQLFSTMHSATDRRGVIYGDKGYMEIENINNPESVKIFDNDHKCIKSYDIQEIVNGYEYELIECVESIKEGKIYPDSMSHEDTLFVMNIFDNLRKDWDFVYPEEIECL